MSLATVLYKHGSNSAKKYSNHTEIMRSKVLYSKLYSSLYFSASRNCNFFNILEHCAHRHSMYKICGLLRTDKVISGLLVQIMMYYNFQTLNNFSSSKITFKKIEIICNFREATLSSVKWKTTLLLWFTCLSFLQNSKRNYSKLLWS